MHENHGTAARVWMERSTTQNLAGHHRCTPRHRLGSAMPSYTPVPRTHPGATRRWSSRRRRTGCQEVATALLGHNADPNQAATDDGATPLEVARAGRPHRSCSTLQLPAGALMLKRRCWGTTPTQTRQRPTMEPLRSRLHVPEGHTAVAALLRQQSVVKVDRLGNCGRLQRLAASIDQRWLFPELAGSVACRRAMLESKPNQSLCTRKRSKNSRCCRSSYSDIPFNRNIKTVHFMHAPTFT